MVEVVVCCSVASGDIVVVLEVGVVVEKVGEVKYFAVLVLTYVVLLWLCGGWWGAGNCDWSCRISSGGMPDCRGGGVTNMLGFSNLLELRAKRCGIVLVDNLAKVCVGIECIIA